MLLRHVSTVGLLACGLLLSLSNCASDEPEAAIDTADLLERTIGVGDSLPLVANLDSPTAVVLTVDCGVPSNVDLTGSLVSVDVPTLDQAEQLAGSARAGFWQWAGVMPAGENPVTIHNEGDQTATCRIGMSLQGSSEEGTCSSWSVHRSEIGTAVHLPVGDTSNGSWEELPASGNHWGAWATWGKVYAKPVLRGFYLHNLEHGGLVLSYGCKSADESDACAEAEASLIELANTFGQNRILVTPDPDQPTMYSVRAWRWAYASDCFDQDSALDFMKSYFRHGREDIEQSPPLDFDPTTTEGVPCQVLMAAPDGC